MYFCARCSGQYLTLVLYLLFNLLRPQVAVPIWCILILPLFSTVDWLTQTLKLRYSNNLIRFTTGGAFGVWLGILIHSVIILDTKLLLFLLVQAVLYTIVVLIILYRKDGCIDEYVKPYEEFIQQYQKQKKSYV